MLLGCQQKADTAVDKAATDVKDKAVAVAKDAEALAKQVEARETGIEAYIYAYPLVTMEMTRRVLTNFDAPTQKGAPMGQWLKLRAYPSPDDKQVTAPNADTLYTITWFDVSKEPWVVSAPDMKGRFFLLPMLDGWTDVFADPGKRTTGTGAQKFAVTGPGLDRNASAGRQGIQVADRHRVAAWAHLQHRHAGGLQGSARVAGPDDRHAAVRVRQAVHAAARKVDPSIDTKTPVRDQVNAMDGAAYFKLFAELLKTNPPAADDAPMVAKLAKIGIVPGQDFDPSKLDPAVAKGLAEVPKPANEKIMGYMKESLVTGDSKLVNGWTFSTKVGTYGTDYQMRALVTAIGLGANRPQDAVYPTSTGPDILKKYSGANKYVMHFNKGRCRRSTASGR